LGGLAPLTIERLTGTIVKNQKARPAPQKFLPVNKKVFKLIK
jgi:hypothetical protein